MSTQSEQEPPRLEDGEHFHPQTGMGDIEAWLPIKA